MIVVLGSEGGLGWWRAVAALGKPARALSGPANPEAEASRAKRRFGENDENHIAHILVHCNKNIAMHKKLGKILPSRLDRRSF
jgi:hypothetical protein